MVWVSPINARFNPRHSADQEEPKRHYGIWARAHWHHTRPRDSSGGKRFAKVEFGLCIQLRQSIPELLFLTLSIGLLWRD